METVNMEFDSFELKEDFVNWLSNSGEQDAASQIEEYGEHGIEGIVFKYEGLNKIIVKSLGREEE